jgi:alpha-galactosidase
MLRGSGDSFDTEERSFVHALVCAAGGLVLSGDDLSSLKSEQLAMLREMASNLPRAARFGDDLTHGTLEFGNATLHVLLNWTDRRDTTRIFAPGEFTAMTDSGSTEFDTRVVRDSCDVEIPAHSGRVVMIWPGHPFGPWH